MVMGDVEHPWYVDFVEDSVFNYDVFGKTFIQFT